MKHFEATAGADQDSSRLDRALADMNPDVSRSEIQRDIRAGRVRVDGEAVTRRSYRVREGDRLTWESTSKPPLDPRPLDLTILYEDDHVILVDKPPGLVVHPGAGTTATTLVEALLVDRELPASDDPTRPGIVHRLDKETSGVILVAKTSEALSGLQAQFAARTTSKTYIALVEGIVAEEEGWIDAPLGRDPRMPSRMAVQPAGREAQTGFSVLKRLEDSTVLVVRPRTGRTHQIRVHCRYIKHPVVGDPVYGTRSSRNQAKQHTSSERDPCSEGAGGDPVHGSAATGERMKLHAWRLGFDHPATGEAIRFEAAIPAGFPDAGYDNVPWIATPARK